MSEGFAPAVTELTGLGMITLRADLSAPPLAAALSALGLQVPARRGIQTAQERMVAWMSPDELLLVCPAQDSAVLIRALDTALGGVFATLADVSDARAMFEVSGPGAREVLAKLTPADLHPGSFGPGEMRRTRLAQVAAALWMPAPDTVRVICFRSVAQYVADLLANAAAPGGAMRVFPD
jgi:sarcosine oxidase subunit gamma